MRCEGDMEGISFLKKGSFCQLGRERSERSWVSSGGSGWWSEEGRDSVREEAAATEDISNDALRADSPVRFVRKLVAVLLLLVMVVVVRIIVFHSSYICFRRIHNWCVDWTSIPF